MHDLFRYGKNTRLAGNEEQAVMGIAAEPSRPVQATIVQADDRSHVVPEILRRGGLRLSIVGSWICGLLDSKRVRQTFPRYQNVRKKLVGQQLSSGCERARLLILLADLCCRRTPGEGSGTATALLLTCSFPLRGFRLQKSEVTFEFGFKVAAPGLRT